MPLEHPRYAVQRITSEVDAAIHRVEAARFCADDGQAAPAVAEALDAAYELLVSCLRTLHGDQTPQQPVGPAPAHAQTVADAEHPQREELPLWPSPPAR